MTEITINLKFKTYEFRRVKNMGSRVVIYTNKEWINKDVLIIPVPITVTDRWIEKHYDVKTNTYNISFTTNQILPKTIRTSGNIGRAYVPKEWVGLDCIIVEAPILDNF